MWPFDTTLCHFLLVVLWNGVSISSRFRDITLSAYHRLCGSASPVLTATLHSYGSLAWLSDFFFPQSPRGQTPQPIFTQNGSIDVDSCKDVPFAVKIDRNFSYPLISRAPKRSKFCKFLDLENFRSIWPLTLEVRERTPLILYRSPTKVA